MAYRVAVEPFINARDVENMLAGQIPDFFIVLKVQLAKELPKLILQLIQ